MKEIRQDFLEYLTNDLHFSEEESVQAWEKAQKHFPSYDAEHSSDLLTLEVVTRDILRGDFRPELAEVKKVV